jgi:predicted nucleotidyltransferase
LYNTLLEKIGTKKPTVEDFVRKIKDLFYASKKTMFELFHDAKTGSGIDAIGLKKLVQRLSSNTITDEEIEQAYKHASKGVESLTYLEFDKAFSWPK